MIDHVRQDIDSYHLTRLLYQLTYHRRILCAAGMHQSAPQSAMTDQKLVLGTGSLGQVYLHEYLDHQILAATKPLNLNQENVKAFVKEASLIFRLPYPQILPLLALGMSADDIFYLIMDYAFNGTLRQFYPKGTYLPLDMVVSSSLPLTTALQYTYDISIAHRQIKPEYVFTRQDGEVLLRDFALASLPLPIQESPLKALAKYPQDRIALAEDFAAALQQIIPVGRPSAALFSLSLPSTTALPQPEQIQNASGIPVHGPSLLSASSPLTPAPDECPSAEMLLNKHQPVLATPPIPYLPTTISDLILQGPSKSLKPRQFTYYNSSMLLPTGVRSAAFSSSLASPPTLLRHGFVPSQPPIARRALTRKIEFLSVGLLLLLATGSMLFTLAIGIKLVKFSFLATTPPLAPKYVTATAVARAYIAYTTDTKKNGFMFGFDPAHTRWNPHEMVLSKATVRHLKPRWSYATDNAIYSSPAVANGMIYIGSEDHNLYAFNASCHSACQPLWSYTTGGIIYSSPAVANGLVYVGSYDHNLYAFDASCRSACQPLWSYTTDGYIYSSSAVANGLVYVGSYDHKLYAFDASCRSACQPLWSYATDDAISSSPAVANGIVYVGSWDHKLYAFDASCRSACQPLWSYATDDAISSSPAVTNDLVYANSEDGKLYAFDASCWSACQPLWSYAMGNIIISSPTVANGIVYVSSDDDGLYAFDASCRNACQPLWSYATEGPIDSSPVVANGVVYIGSYDHNLYAFGTTTK